MTNQPPPTTEPPKVSFKFKFKQRGAVPAVASQPALPTEPAPPPETQPESEPVPPAPVVAAPKTFTFDITKAVAVAVEHTPQPEPAAEAEAKGKKKEAPPLPASVQALVSAIANAETSVQQELIDEDGQAVTVNVQRKHNAGLLELLREHDVFEYSRLEIGVGTVNTRLSFDSLGVSAEQLAALNNVKARGAPIEMFGALKDAGGELRKMLDKVKKSMAFTGGSWICADLQLPKVAIGLEGIEQHCAVLRETVAQSIPKNKQKFLEDIAGVVIATNQRLEQDGRPLVDMEATLQYYAGIFPTADQVRRWFRFEYDGPIYHASLSKQAESDAQMREALNRFTAANLEKAELDAVQRAFSERQRKVQEAVASGMEYARTQVLKTFAGIVSSLSNSVEKGRVHGKTRNSLTEEIANLKTMLEQPFVPPEFSELVTDAERFQSLAQSETLSKELMQAQLDAALAKLQQKYEFKPPTAESGHRGGYIPSRQKTQPTAVSPDANVA